MKKLFSVTVAVIVIVIFVARWMWPTQESVDATGSVTGTVAGITDGDTIRVTADGQTLRVRLLGIDAPEISHGSTPSDCGGDAAKTALAELLPIGTTVTLTYDAFADKQDQYGRHLSYVATRTIEDVALMLIEAGLVAAWIPAGEPKPERWEHYTQAMAAAQTNQAGSWPVCVKLGR